MTTEVLRGATRWKVFLQASRTFLNQNVRDQTTGKPKFRGQKVEKNEKCWKMLGFVGKVLEGATRWKFFLQASRSFLNQNFRDQNSGKPKFRGQNFRVNRKISNEYSIFRVCLGICWGMFWGVFGGMLGDFYG